MLNKDKLFASVASAKWNAFLIMYLLSFIDQNSSEGIVNNSVKIGIVALNAEHWNKI